MDIEDGAGPAKRKLKILHVGNIANNAYLNAKLLRERGHECHVACYDFYHFAGCSEWLDLNFPVDHTSLDDPNFPNFWKLGDKKPPSPRWFAQGPQTSVINYLYWLNVGNCRAADLAWSLLQYQRFKITYRRDTMAFQEIWNKQRLFLAFEEMNIDPRFMGEMINALRSDDARYLVYDWNRRVGINSAHVSTPTFPLAKSWLEDYALYDPPLRVLLEADIDGTYLSAIGFIHRPLNDSSFNRARIRTHPGSEAYGLFIENWRELFGFYDFVLAYGPSTILPYLAECPTYLAYEHGTLRDLPFDGTIAGELISASYESASAVFVTNNDYLDQSRQLNILPERLHPLPHAFDERPLRDYIAANPPIPKDTVTFFAPARQDWIKQFPSMTKNNHFVVHAAHALFEEGWRDFKILFIEWGDDVAATKELIEHLQMECFFEWQAPLAKQQLWSAYASAHAVIDQFLLPSISGVSFEALALGRRVITCDNGVSNLRAFGEQPPFLIANDIPGVIDAMRQVLTDPADKAGIGDAAWHWTDRRHSARRITQIQEAVFEGLGASSEPSARIDFSASMRHAGGA